MFDYKKFPPIGQDFEMTCWAACLSWWLTAIGEGRPRRSQSDLYAAFENVMAPGGGFDLAKLAERLNSAPGFKIRAGFFKPADYRFKRLPTGNSPVLIVFRPPENSDSAPHMFHMNVVVAQESQTVTTMEPYFPVPCEDGARTGAYLTRDLAFFLDNSPTLMLAWGKA